MGRAVLWVVLVWLPASLAAAEYSEPARGTQTRQALMDAIRPHAEWNLGVPVEFVVDDLRVAGDVGYAELSPQRPGGAAIDIYQTPMYRRGQADPEFQDGMYMHVLYRKSGATWVAVHFSIGATDVWFSDPELCREYRAVIPEFCN
ncbi:MAG: hypothetical protein K8F59_09265 [Rhodobacteraceae bacterium]|nr:hypothetical protein [Paracoccaceae bacterium]